LVERESRQAANPSAVNGAFHFEGSAVICQRACGIGLPTAHSKSRTTVCCPSVIRTLWWAERLTLSFCWVPGFWAAVARARNSLADTAEGLKRTWVQNITTTRMAAVALTHLTRLDEVWFDELTKRQILRQ